MLSTNILKIADVISYNPVDTLSHNYVAISMLLKTLQYVYNCSFPETLCYRPTENVNAVIFSCFFRELR